MIHVQYEVYDTIPSITSALSRLDSFKLLSYDCETQSIYTPDDKEEAKELLKDHSDDISPEDTRLCKVALNSSGLSYPSIVKVTHFIFGTANDYAIILVAYTKEIEQLIMDWIPTYQGKLLIHNSLFDLKLVYNRTNQFPLDYEDTQLLAKSYINHTENWKANTGLKELMGSYYDPKWSMIETYDIVDYLDPDFIRYCSIDGAATFHLYELLLEHKKELL